MGTPPSLHECLDEWVDTKQPLTSINTEIKYGMPQASGVLPFCIVENTVFYLLGKESYRKGFYEYGTWCDFGGSITKKAMGEFDPALVTAAQELLEESIGTCAKDNSNLKDVCSYIQNNLYMVITSFFGKKIPYRMYVVRIPFSNIPEEFQIRHRIATRFRFPPGNSTTLANSNKYLVIQREKLREKQPHLFTKAGRTKRHFLEKDSLQWVSSDVLQQCLDNGRQNSPLNIKLRSEFAQTLVKEDVLRKLNLIIKADTSKRVPPPPGFDEGDLIKK